MAQVGSKLKNRIIKRIFLKRIRHIPIVIFKIKYKKIDARLKRLSSYNLIGFCFALH